MNKLTETYIERLELARVLTRLCAAIEMNQPIFSEEDELIKVKKPA